MKTMKKAMAVAAAIGLTVTGSGLSYGAAVAETSSDATAVSYENKSFNNTAADKGTDSVITGHIKVTDISVKVPITSSFDIDPNKGVKEGEASGQVLGQAANYTITNLSAVPLDVTITKVAAGVTSGDPVSLVKTVDGLQTKRAVMFAIRKAGETAPLLAKDTSAADYGKWMSDTGDTAISASKPYKVSVTEAENTIQAADDTSTADELTMTIYAATKKGWTAGDSFTVTPTFTVALHTTP